MFSFSLYRALVTTTALVALSCQTVACGPTVVSGNGGELSSGSGGSGGSGGNGGAGGSDPGDGNAIAMFRSQFPPPGGGGSSAVSSGGGDLDPNDLFIFIGNPAVVCEDPFAYGGCPHWKVFIGIPPHLQEPGTYDLAAPEFLYSGFSVSGENTGPDDCWGGGGSFSEGTLEITTIDNEWVRGQLVGTPAFDFDANGPFSASRCP